MYLGLEIGGTKLQLAVGDGTGKPLVALERFPVERQGGAQRILHEIDRAARPLIQQYSVTGMGVGFGGPCDVERGRTIKSHHVPGWEDFPLARWLTERLGCPVCIENDCNAAALAEAHFGAGRGFMRVFYVTVGTGIGGGLVVNGTLYGAGAPAVAEIGHLRPGLQAVSPGDTVEAAASGLGIETHVRRCLDEWCRRGQETGAERGRRGQETGAERGRGLETCAQGAQCGEHGAGSADAGVEYAGAPSSDDGGQQSLWDACGGNLDRLSAELIAHAAALGNPLAAQVLSRAVNTLGWAIAQAVTLTAPERVVVGGGVANLNESLFWSPLRQAVRTFVFPPLAVAFQIVPAELGEEVVLWGAIWLARNAAHESRADL